MGRYGLLIAALLAVLACTPGCTADKTLPGQPRVSIELSETPFFPQEAYQCGPAALATVLRESGIRVSPDELVSKVYLPGRQGSLQLELIAATRRYERLPYVLPPTVEALFAELEAGRPVLVLQNLGVKLLPRWHYAVVVGYDSLEGRFVLRSGTTMRRLQSVSKFLKTWRRSGFWAMVTLELGVLPAAPDEAVYLKAAAGLEAAGETRAALAAYAAARSRWPDSLIVLLGLGNTHYISGDLASAEASYRALLAADPVHTVALNNLAQVLSDRGCYEEASITIERALAAGGGEGAFASSLQETQAAIAAQQGGDSQSALCSP